jgi:hypothetical protein
MSIVLVGSTSGSITLQEPAVSGSTILSLPAVSGTVLTTTSPKAGNVIQVVSAIQSSGTSTTSGTFIDSGLSASITPTSATSKILVIITQCIYSGGTTSVASATQLLRGSTVLLVEGYSFYVGDNFYRSSFNYLDSPATTSSTTYKTQFRKNTGGGTAIIYSYGDGGGQTNSSITLMEIAA